MPPAFRPALPIAQSKTVQRAQAPTVTAPGAATTSTQKAKAQEARLLIEAMITSGLAKGTDAEALTACSKRLASLYVALDGDAKAAGDTFTLWKTTSTYQGGGMEDWEVFQTLRKQAAERDAKQATAKAAPSVKEAKTVKFSKDCDAVFADMEKQFSAWSGTLATRGAWWGAAAPGNPAGAKSVSSAVVTELKARVAGSGWRFENSMSGALSFHRKRSGTTIEFIYHMQPPADD